MKINGLSDSGGKKLADYALFFDLFSTVGASRNEKEVLDGIAGVFHTVCTPAYVAYLPFYGDKSGPLKCRPRLGAEQEAKIAARFAAFDKEYAWTGSGKGFVLRISHAGEKLGVIELEGMAFPEYREHYLNLALNSAAVLGLAIANARTYHALEEKNKELAASELRYRLLVESSPLCIHEIGPDGRLLSMNRAGLNMLGLKEEKDVRGKAYLDSVGQADRERIGELLRQALNGKFSQFEFASAGAAPRRFSSCFVPLRNDAGGVEKLMGITDDITERKHAEEALRESEERFKMLTEVAHEGVALSVNGIILDSNEQYAKLLGYDKVEEVKGFHVVDMVAPEFREYVKGILQRNWDKPYEAVLVRKDGTRRTFEAFGHQTMYKGQKVRISTVVDITERKRAEQALFESENKYRALVEKTSDWVWELDENGVFTYSSPQVREITGHAVEEILGKTPFNYMRTEEAGRAVEFFRATSATRKPFKSFENTTLHKDGHEVIIETSGVPYFNAEGRFMGYRGINRDITARKMAEGALRAAKEEAERATALKDKYVALVSHDLKNPLGAMMGFLKLIREDLEMSGDERTARLTDAAMEGARQMQRLINEVLSISRIKSGLTRPKPKFFDGYILGAKAEAALGPEAAKKSVALVNAIPEGTRLHADEALLGEVVNNLVSNAVKFSKSGGAITIFVPENEPACVAVKDTGVGIRADHIPKLFIYEEKTTTAGTAGERGTGLGLPLSHDIVAMLDGKLDVESEVGRGSVFYIRLPFVKPRVLLVDDDADMRFIIKKNLAAINVETVEAESGADALAMARENPPHLIILDLMMPGLDGFAVLERLKGDERTSAVPVVVITAASDVKTRDNVFRSGADDYVPKPVPMNDFIPRIRRFLG